MSSASPSIDRPRGRAHAAHAAIALVAATSLTCSGPDGLGRDSVLRGRVWLGGAVAGARVDVYQLVDGERTRLLDSAVTGAAGDFELTVDGYEHFELVAAGGGYHELVGGAIVLPAGQVLRGAVLDVATGSVRADVAVTPFTDVMIELARARAAGGEPFNHALAVVHARLQAHLGFDPTATAIGELAGPLPANADGSQHALALAGLSTMAATAAAQLRVTVQDVNTLSLVRALIADAGSAEARLDGNVDGAGVAPLHVGAVCPPDVPGARGSCRITSNTLRARLAAGVLSFLVGERNHTGLGRADVLAWVTAIAGNADGELFGGDAPERIDRTPPRVTWVTPVADARLAGVVAVEVRAEDELGLDSIVVAAVTTGPDPAVLATVVDADPTPGRFAGDLTVSGLPEGAIELRAIARDVSDEVTISFRPVVIDEVHGGTIAGVVVKGRVAGATVRVRRYDGGLPGALLGQGVTAADGTFAAIAIADGYTGPLLVEAGAGGSYREEAGPATVTLDVGDALRTIVPAYADGGAPSDVVVSPLTTFAVTYRELLASAGLGGATVAAQWQSAAGAIETHFGVANIRTLAPLAPEDMTTLTAGARHGLVLVGLSELARRASTAGGGDAGTFGVAASSIAVVRRWQQDLADGCWNGRAGAAVDAPGLFYGGTQALGDDPTRRGLANAIAGYLDSARNATAFTVADVLPLLDTLATGGGASAAGNCGATPGQPGSGTLVVGAGEGFDQLAPIIAIAPAEHAVVRGAVLITATASDNLDLRPTLAITAPAALVGQDLDGDATDADARVVLDTATEVGAEGVVAITLESEDDAGTVGVATRHLVVDNVPPVISIAGVTADGFHVPPVTITYAATDTHPGTVTATVDGAPFQSGAAVVADGSHTLVVDAADLAGNTARSTLPFTVDGTPPVLTLDPSGLTAFGGVLWTTVASPELAVEATDANLLDVRALRNGVVVATDQDGQAPWRLPIPAPTIPTAADVTLELVARDRAGNATTVTRRFRHDASAPVLVVHDTIVHDERDDLVSFTPGLDPLDLRVNHAHSGAAVVLGPATACNAAAPTVSKYGYLLDAALPPYVTETAPVNPLAWAFTAADDGIGVDPATVAYRVRDVAADQLVLDWTGLTTPIPGTYAVTLYRHGGAQPSIPSLGTRTGRFELQLRAVDRLGRSAIVTRCWNHEPLPAPLRIDAAGAAAAGPAGSGKYALAALQLDDTTSPIDPIADQVLDDPPAGELRFGTGLLQFAVRNPTTETVYLTIDLTRPQSATYAKTQVLGRSAIDDEAGFVDCGPSVDAFGEPVAPDASLPYCVVGAVPLGGGATTTSGPAGTAPDYGVRVWEAVTATDFVELTTNCPAPGCTQATADKIRLTVRLPPRQVSMFGDPLPARTFWVMPVVRTIDALRPDVGPFSEFTAGGAILTGKVLTTDRRCRLALTAIAGRWRCTGKRTFRGFNALKSASFSLGPPISTDVGVSTDGLSPSPPPYVVSATRAWMFGMWSTSEPSL